MQVSYGIWGSFLSYAFVMAFSPGPNNILLLNATSSRGLAGSRYLLAGVCAGLLGVMFAFGVFGAFLSAYMPNAATFLKYPGAAYILWLAWKVGTAKETGDEETAMALSFREGFVLQFLNVKNLLYGATVFTAFTLPIVHPLTGVAVQIAVVTLIGCMGAAAWAVMGSAFQGFLARYRRSTNIAMALLLIQSAFSIALGK